MAYNQPSTPDHEERDGLTDLRGYHSLINDWEAHAGDDVYVMICDVDNFRNVNEIFGRDTGDEVIKRIGKIIRQAFGDAHAFRYGGDEFIIVNSFYSEDALLDKIDAVDRRIVAIEMDGRRLHLTCSYGYARGEIGNSAELLEAVRLADRRMYEAKRLGKARAVGSSLADELQQTSGRSAAGSYRSYEVDELTGLANLVYFRAALARELADARADEPDPAAQRAVVYFNIENFKAYNQRYGFDAGNDLLLLISEAIGRAFPGDLASRHSADQFSVLTTKAKVSEGFESVRTAFRAKMKDSSIWLRAGYYVIAPEDEDAGVVCDRAKIACDAVRGRRDKFCREYDEDMRHKVVWRRYVLDHFEEALENGWIKAFCQPIVRVATGEVCDVEALARWIDPIEGVISPADFVPVLEEARLIHKLDLQIVRDVCEDCLELMDHGLPFIPPSINLSRLDFELCDIVGEIEKILEEFRIPRHMMSIEVTESALTGNQEFLRSEVDRFRADGFEVWMDDFGSGYSSLNVLKDYKFDLVKIDMEFLRGFESKEESRIVLAYVINMAKELGLKTLVEGVETKEQYEFLRSIGCGRAQGYYLGKPLGLPESIEAQKTHRYPSVELSALRDFFGAVGRVNLMRPDPQPSVDGHFLPCDTPASIILKRDGRYEYLNTNALYAKFLKDVGIGTVHDSEKVINDPSNPRRTAFVGVIDACVESETWQHYSLDVDGKTLKVRMKKMSEQPEFDAVAVLSIVDEIVEV